MRARGARMDRSLIARAAIPRVARYMSIAAVGALLLTGAGREQLTGGTVMNPATTWTFDSAATDQPPPGFAFGRTGSGRRGRWIVRAAPDAPSAPNVLA